MGKAFDDCVNNGGYIKTVQKGKGKYQRVCIIKGKTYKGLVKTIKKKKTNG